MKPISPLCGFTVHVSQMLVGAKKAIKQGNSIYVSPAMYDLISHANQEELKRILSAISFIEIPTFDFFDLPMTTIP